MYLICIHCWQLTNTMLKWYSLSDLVYFEKWLTPLWNRFIFYPWNKTMLTLYQSLYQICQEYENICYWLLSAHYISLPYYSCSHIKPIMNVICKLGAQSTSILHGRYHQHYHSCRPVVLIYYVWTVFVQSSTNCILSFKIIYHYWVFRLLRKPLSEIAK